MILVVVAVMIMLGPTGGAPPQAGGSPPEGGFGRGCGADGLVTDRLEEFFEFTSIQPNPPALRTDIDFDIVSPDGSHPDGTIGTNQQRHLGSP
jgi:hypothetical protein